MKILNRVLAFWNLAIIRLYPAAPRTAASLHRARRDRRQRVRSLWTKVKRTPRSWLVSAAVWVLLKLRDKPRKDAP